MTLISQLQKVRGFPAKNLMGIPTAGMIRPDWLEARAKMARFTIGGSEIGVLLRLDNRFSSPIRMFYERLGLWEDTYRDNQYAFMGRALEATIIDLWRHWQGDWESTMIAHDQGKKSRKSRACRYILYNPRYKHLMANLDHKIVFSPDSPTGKGIVEAKTLSGHASDRYETGLPPKHIAQVQQYLLITGEQYAELAVLKNGVEFQVYPVTASETIQNKIVEVTDEFFENRIAPARRALNVLPMNAAFEEKVFAVQTWEPPVEAADDEYEFLSEKAKRLSMAGEMHPDEQIIEWFRLATDAKQAEDDAAELKQYYQNQIRQEMTGRGIYRYKWETGVITNGKRFVLKKRKDE